ncbi:metallopeptidase TldD-related protein [Tunturiibacter gelidoferens]|uniref:Zn-dependent protease n=1 Tax=Tunturiibacter gelidiferens TaxID=3069689 RepID=A0ACC5P288_9BACT|nr:putative Zn-dependent protease [Edaphobacter lichenicola]
MNDPLLRAMQEELDREKALLLPNMQRPYFVEYRLDDMASYEAVANYGALTREEENRQRIVRVTVRIGDYAVDSSTSRGDGTLELAPTDDNPEALRYALWTATDTAYKNALRAYSAKQAALKQFQSMQAQPDFAQAKAVIQISPLIALDLDRAEWKRRIVEASGLFVSDPQVRSFAEHVQYSTANIRGIALNRYLVNTEGTVLRQGYTGYDGAISVGGQAADGMRLSRDNGTVAANAKELESAGAFRKRAIEDLKSFEELRNAPVVSADDYHGPVLFSGDAAADVIDRLLVPNVEADRPEMGTTARTTGAYSSSFKARVLPEMLSVTDDPLKAKFDGKALLGAYTIDDEGVPAQSVDIIVNGKLENFLIGREPVKDFDISNGHGRAAPAQAAHSRAGVILVKSSQPLSRGELNKRLLTMAKEQGRDVYSVETLGGELLPRLLYLVHPDGTRKLVRGAIFDELDNRSLRSHIVAIGNDPYVSNSLGTVPQTTIAPSMLFDDIGVKRATLEQQKLPYYAPPALPGK